MLPRRNILAIHALPYANGAPHLGHLVGIIQADIWVRLQKMLGHHCLYICGSDSHGTPIMIQAEKMGIAPEVLIEQVRKEQERDFADYLVEFDNYYTTHSPENRLLAETIFQRHAEKNNITKRSIKQFFDPIKNMFLPDRYIKGECPKCGAPDQYGDNCEVCSAIYSPTELKNPISVLSGTKPIEKESEHYFFKLQNYTDFLQKWIRNGHLSPQVANKVEEWFATGLREWDISRDKPYFGFTIPGEQDKYFYVWLDAPIGYMATFKNLCTQRKDINFSDYWGKDSTAELYHFIGKDIIYFHALFWPALLHGADFRTPSAIFVNGFLTIDGKKMSKSRGTLIKARTYLKHLPPEYLRYYLAAKLTPHMEDLDINFNDFTLRINSDLIGKFINIASRCASFLNKYFSGRLSPQLTEASLYNEFVLAGDHILIKWQQMEYSQAIRQITALADRANQYIDEKKPWTLIKDPSQQQAVQAICSTGINLFRLLMIYLKPVLPHTAKQVETFLNISPLKWHDKDSPLLDHTIQQFQALLSRIDPKQIEEMKMAAQQDIDSTTPVTTQIKKIGIDDFNQIDLRVAKILAAESVEGADKLLRLTVDLGTETRQIFAGIKSAYQPEQLIDRCIVVVANLAPRQMRFGTSDGMLLAAGSGGNELWLLSPDKGAQPGMKIK
jgi:methionyl-tRNA synthetase